MTANTITRTQLHQAMAAGSTVVTSNARLAQLLLREFEQQKIAAGQVAWQTPDILPITGWLQREWQTALLDYESAAPALLLTQEQELQVWSNIIEDTSDGLLRVAATARQAQQAWSLLQSWQVACLRQHFNHNQDSQAFFSWAKIFEQQCKRHNWLASQQLSDELVRLYHGVQDLPDKDLLWIGFDELTPQQVKLMEALQSAGNTVRWVKFAGCESNIRRLACTDSHEEAETLSRWVRAKLENDPQCRIGIVAPDLAASQHLLHHALTKTLLPQSLTPESGVIDAMNRPWNISLGRPLTDYPIIQTALQVLTLLEGTVSLDVLATLLHSPHLGGGENEASARALLDVKLREVGDAVVSLSTVQMLAATEFDKNKNPNQWYAPEFANCLKSLIRLQQQCPLQQRAGQWASEFSACLTAMGWTAGRSLSSEEYQTAEAWRKTLLRFAGLDAVIGQLDRHTAVRVLKQLLATRIFQPQSNLAPVQVLGLYEAIGMEFDALWIMDLDDKHWPPSPRPNPFIPLALQRQHGLPHASVERELAVARTVMQRLCRSATDIIVSYPTLDNDQVLRPSPLISDFKSVEKSDLPLWPIPHWRDAVCESSILETVSFEPIPALAADKVTGGSQIFKHQALCPFRAFAEQRLGAKGLREPELGLDNMQRGSLLHTTLELFWAEVKSHTQLMAMSDAQLDKCLSNNINTAMTALQNKGVSNQSQRFRQLESQRLLDLLKNWLAIEKERQAFTVVGLEKSVQAKINGIEVRLFIDRVDQLDDGRKVIIDYKTGKVSPSQWFGERPEDPQLPLYSTVEEGEIAAVVFGQVRADGSQFNGVVASSELIPGLPPKRKGDLTRVCEQWPAVLDEWTGTINQLAEDFRQGIATVDPLRGVTTCQSSYCRLTPLCRIHERTDIKVSTDD